MFAGIGAGRRLDRCRGSSKARCLNCQTQPWPGRCLVLVSPSHGENRGSSPLGSANSFKALWALNMLVWVPSPTFLQWTLLPIGWRPPFDRRLEEAGRDWRSHRRAGVGAYFAEQIEHAAWLAAVEDRATCLG